MKLSLKNTDDQRRYPLIKAKIPITVFNLPFTTSVATTHPSAVSFSLSTNFSSGPSLKLSTNTSSATTTSPPPLSFSLKSGPASSAPLRIRRFSSLPTSPSFPPPTLIPLLPSKSSPDLVENGFVPGEPLGWRELTMGSCSGKDGLQNPNLSPNPNVNGVFGSEVWKMDSCGGKGGIWSGFAVTARTVLPVTKRVAVNCRWGVNFPEKGTKLPFLTVDKVEIERVEEVKDVKVKSVKRDSGDLELLKGMCFWMKRDLEVLEKENREMKQSLEEIRLGLSPRKYGGDSIGVGRKQCLIPVRIRVILSAGGARRAVKKRKEEGNRRSL
ncbi:hypothetical protein CK203_017225 [Vitis vinifera]|uniref:Uncharacterized protein n=1 Tax=Vitis vinifera TaxID=29760 RepID=A0A438JZS1_VITVI|nr:hypothetical protein CK203_017225 [Vitis vinifera]